MITKRKNHLLGDVIPVIIIAAILIVLKEFKLISTSRLLILQYIGLYSIFVLGINMVNGYLGIFSLAHAGFMASGAYAAAISSKYFFKESWMFPLILLFGGLIAMLIGLIMSIPSFKAKGDYLAIITLGFSLIVQSFLQNWRFVGASKGINNVAKFTNIYWVYGCLLFAIIIVRKFINSKYGRSLKAIREDQVASELVSVDVKRAKTIAFAVSAFLIGISGALLVHLLGYTSPSAYGYTNIVDGLVMVYLGGMGSITGSIVGATLWQILIQTLKNLGTWRWVVGGGLLCVIMIFLTNGIFGNKELSDAIHAIRKYFSRSKTNKTISEETTK
ncbi:branched-chain amino acid ABC transporter permease [Flexilinea flocculi]|jgi:branched-chain amino acid transport system permease protein|uniref:ABC-type branched-chain amino acid transport system, permease component n=1 Tax=Flexilinea flocculi TaxID=1678840 RepID=A0A0S7BYD2_9CHLR|nr:branched-chain amino acid ABC transporter permease [Flexilinea flocculi]NMB93506.1 branched-chain amino acid ABC transporter permease [Flexilinea flocculi]GAP41475.1 ABC-type branched-chain amino acid transport system, permease component [Flexilinea flocculi]